MNQQARAGAGKALDIAENSSRERDVDDSATLLVTGALVALTGDRPSVASGGRRSSCSATAIRPNRDAFAALPRAWRSRTS